jgi:protease secretion system membrane fusion protein
MLKKSIEDIVADLRSLIKPGNEKQNSLKQVGKDENYYIKLGWGFLIIFFGGFFLWAGLAPIDKGVAAPGTVIVSGQKKVIQSAVNGVVENVLVKDGDQVKQGQTLIKLNDLQNSSLVIGTRENIIGLEAQIKALEVISENQKRQLTFITEQLVGVRELAKEGYIARNRLLELERTNAQVNASLAESLGTLERYKRQVNELKSRLNSQEFDLSNTEVKAPYDGSILNIEVLARGSVVQSGARLMEIAPRNLPLMIETMVPVNLIDKVQDNLPVEIIFSALNQRKTPKIPGRVVTVPADRSTDKQTGAPFYKVLVEVTDKGMRRLGDNLIRPGMPAEVFIVTGERTMLNYLLRPLIDRAYTSMREE